MALTVIPLSGLASDVVDSISAGAGGGGPRIANVQIANSSWGLLDDTAVSTDGGYVLINGSGFVSGCSVLVANSQATPVTFANSSLLRVEVPAKSASTYAVYVLNPDGGTAIGINALTYSAFPAWATGSTLSSGSADVEISVQLSASDATTYTLQAGSSLPANTTLASNGLFSGTITGINEETTYTFTVEATDAQNQNTPRTFSITITVGDSNFKNTTLLLNADANTYVRDASNNAFAITVNGDTSPSAFSPHNTNWSNYFDGVSDSLSFNTSTALSLSGAFTIEFWIYLESLSLDSINPSIITFPTQPNAWQVYVNSAGSYIGIYNGTSDVVNTTSSSITANRWYHVAISRDASSNMAIFLDGVRKGSTASGAGTIGSTTGTIYFMSYGNNTGDVKGYLSNLRIVKGNAVYDPTQTTLTVPTTALTAVSNTQLLICQSNRIIDNSTNAFTITKNGNVAVSSFGPFTETDVTTGSGYFDGSGDYLNTSNTQIIPASTTYSVEAWVYLTGDYSVYREIVTQGSSGNANRWLMYVNITDGTLRIQTGATSLTTSFVIPLNTWTHVAFVNNAGSYNIYANGTSVASGSSAMVPENTYLTVGAFQTGTEYFQGYISNVRISNVARSITVPSSSYTSDNNTRLLTLQNRTGITNHQFVDESGINHLFTRGGNASQGSFSPYSPAGWSGYFDGTGDYLTVASIGTMTGDFTYECWIFPLSTAALFLPAQIGSEAAGRFYAAINTSRTINLEYYGAGTITLSGATVTANEWNHLAITRSGSTMRGFINGVLAGSTTSITGTIGNAGSTFIGASSAGSAPINGYISNLRIVRGTALYTSNFTPPTSPLTPISNTVLLTLRTGSFVDESANRFAITRNGDVKIEPFSPFKSHTITANTHSVYFDGSGDYLSVPNNSAFAYGTGDFTIEFWFYMSAVAGSGNYYVLFDGRPSSTSGAYVNITINNATPESYVNGALVISGSALSAGIWYHFAYARSGSSTKMFINGTQVGSTYTDTTNYINGADRPVIGTNGFNVAQYNFNGYISNVRIVKGTAVYTSAFTPSTTPLTAISNTVLLTCQSTTIIDNSTNAFTITVTGNVIPSKFNPFGETIAQGVEYRANTHGGSAYFDGTDDNLITSSSSNLALGSGDFTIEMWVYPNNTSSAYRGLIASDAYSGTTNGWTVYQYGTNIEMYYSSGGSTPNIFTASSVLVAGVWQHVAISRSSGTLKCFVNGVQVASVSNSIAFVGSIIYIGDNNAGNYFYSGYISDVRIVKGTALYKAAFIPPTTTLGAIKETVLLLNNDRGGIMDVSSRNVLECVGDARVRTDTKKYGSGAMFFDGTGDNLTIPSSPSLDFGAGDFTVELWANFSALSTNRILLDRWASGNAGGWQLYWRGTGTSITFFVNATVILQDANTTRITTGTWYHIALARSGSTVRLFVDGTSVGSNTLTTSLTSTLPMFIGVQGSTSTNYLSGYIDDLRITKGVARYTTNFTAPTSAHQTK